MPTPSIATQIATLRAETGLTLEAFAARCGLTASSIQRYEKGTVSPTVEALEKIAHGTDRPLNVWFGPPLTKPTDPDYIGRKLREMM